MFILRLDEKLRAKVKLPRLSVVPPHENPFNDWTARLFAVGRFRYILLANTRTLYSCILHSAGVVDDAALLDRAFAQIRSTMESDGLGDAYMQHIASANGSVRFSTASNRAVTGSLNELVAEAKSRLADSEIGPCEAADVLNGTPLSMLKEPAGAVFPLATMKRLAALLA